MSKNVCQGAFSHKNKEQGSKQSPHYYSHMPILQTTLPSNNYFVKQTNTFFNFMPLSLLYLDSSNGLFPQLTHETLFRPAILYQSNQRL